MKKKYKSEFILFFIMLVLISILSTKYYFRIDTTKKKLYSLSEYTKNTIDNLDSTLKITWFKSKEVFSFFPSLRYLNDLLLEYKIYGKERISVENKNIETLSEEKIKNLEIIPRQIESKNINYKTIFSIYSGLLIEYKGENRTIPFIDDIDILEYDIARFIEDINLKENKYNKKSKIAIIAPPNSLETDYQFVKPWLEYAGFNIIRLNLPINYIPSDIPILVIGSNYLDFLSANSIDIFLKKNGNAVFFVSGNTVNYKTNWKAEPKIKDFLLPVLAKYGFVINSDLVLDLINFRIQMNSTDNSSSKFINYPFWLQIQSESIKKKHPIFAGYKNLQTFWPSSMNLVEEKNIILAKTTPKAISMTENYNTEPFGKQLNLFAEFNSEEKTIIAEKKDKNKILVISDEYIISKAIDFTGTSYNMDFMVNCVEYICGKDNLILLKNKQHTATPFKKFNNNKDFLSIVIRTRIFNLIILPLTILIFGIYIIVFTRKEK